MVSIPRICKMMSSFQPPAQVGRLPTKKDGLSVLILGSVTPESLDNFVWEMALSSISHPKNVVVYTKMDPRDFKELTQV